MTGKDSLTRSLRDLLASAGLPAAAEDAQITGVTADSRDVRRGSLFVAIPGTAEDGHRFVQEAVEAGASAIVGERTVEVRDVPLVRVDDARRALADLAVAWYDRPAEDVGVVGITGSLGKTTVLTVLESILEAGDLRVGAIGSEIVGMRVHDRFDVETRNTTPDPITLHRGIRLMADSGARLAVMEVTSHAIDQQRVHGIRFTAGIFTNLVALEHQDYHGSFEEYVTVKCRFLDQLKPGALLIYGADSPRLKQEVASRALNAVSCGFAEDADVRIVDQQIRGGRTSCALEVRKPIPRQQGDVVPATSIALDLRLLGKPHILNAAFAATAALHLGVSPEAIRGALAEVAPPDRRLEFIDMGGFNVLDDTAGHPDSVDAVFEVVSQMDYARLHVVAAIRGHRGSDINRRLAGALARHHRELAYDSLILSDSRDTVDELDHVSDDERAAFLGALEDSGVPYRHHADLASAIADVTDLVLPGDLVVLIGAQGMRAGAAMLRDQMEAA